MISPKVIFADFLFTTSLIVMVADATLWVNCQSSYTHTWWHAFLRHYSYVGTWCWWEGGEIGMSDQIFVAITLMCVCGYPISAACVINPGFGEVFEYPTYCFGCLCIVLSCAGGWLMMILLCVTGVHVLFMVILIVQWVAIHPRSLDEACMLLKFSGLVVRVHTIEHNWIMNICYHSFSEQLSNSFSCTSVQHPSILVFCESAVELLVHNRINDLVIFSDLFIFLSNISSSTSVPPSKCPPTLDARDIHPHSLLLFMLWICTLGACFCINHCEY